jgi:hypothetical protein
VAHALSADQVQVQMEDRLSPVHPRVDNRAIAGLSDALLPGQELGNPEHVPNQRLVFRIEFIERVDVSIGYDQDVGWRHRMRIPESGHLFIAIKNGCVQKMQAEVIFDLSAENRAKR